MTEAPRRDRPDIPSTYGIAAGSDGLLDWPVVDAAIAAAATYWLSTTRPSGEPHITPIWGAWTGRRLYVEGGDDTRWARNLGANPAISVGVDHREMQIVVRGRAALVEPDTERFEAVAAGYAAKYPYRPEEPHPFWEVSPSSILAWDTSTIDSFATTPTRFQFEETP